MTILNNAVICTILLAASGCASIMNVDEPLSECGSRKNPCINARAAYYASQDYDPEVEVSGIYEKRSRKSRGEISPFEPQPLESAVGYPKPLLNQAKVMRVWINSYEDEQGNLVYPTRVYTEVEQRKWDVGYSLKRNGNKGKRVTPLVAKPASENKVEETPVTSNAVSETQPAPNRTSAQSNPIPDTLPQGLIPPLQ